MLLWQLTKGQEESTTKPALQSTLLVMLLDRTSLDLWIIAKAAKPRCFGRLSINIKNFRMVSKRHLRYHMAELLLM